MKDCELCPENNLYRGDILAENEHAFSLSSIDPTLQTAALIISRRHVESPFELNDEEWLALKDLLDQVHPKLSKQGAEAFNVGWNIGETAGQNTRHAHLHVIGRFSDEPLADKGIRYAFKRKSNERPEARQEQ